MDDNLQREINKERFVFFFNDSCVNDSETGTDIPRVFVDLCVKEQSGPCADTGRINHFYEEDIEKWKTKRQEVGSERIVNLLLNTDENIILASDDSSYIIKFREGQEKVEFETQEA